MKVGTVLVALVFSVVVPAQQDSPKDSPSLSETIAWVNQTFNGGHRGLFQQWDDKQTLMLEYTNDFTIDQCHIGLIIAWGTKSKGNSDERPRFALCKLTDWSATRTLSLYPQANTTSVHFCSPPNHDSVAVMRKMG